MPLLIRRWRRVVLGVLMWSLPALYVWATFRASGVGEWRMFIAAAVVLGGVSIWVSIRLARWSVAIDGTGIHLRPPFRTPSLVPWEAIVKVTWAPNRFFIDSPGRPPFAVGAAWDGVPHFAHLVLTRCKTTSFEDDATRRRLARIAVPRRPSAPAAWAPESPAPATFAGTRWQENPFLVLGLTVDASRMDVERAGQKLLAMLTIGSNSAKVYETPLGSVPRTAEAVRAAMAELRDPERRLVHEFWATSFAPDSNSVESTSRADVDGPWSEAMPALGWPGA